MFKSDTELTKSTLFEIEVSKKGNSLFFINDIGCLKESSNSVIFSESFFLSFNSLISTVNISLSFSTNDSFSSLNIKLYLFKAGEFLSVKTLFHYLFFQQDFFQIILPVLNLDL